jgi:hypothetical protein
LMVTLTNSCSPVKERRVAPHCWRNFVPLYLWGLFFHI